MIVLKSVEKILKENLTFQIPFYQRGYRWTSENVKTLIKDIMSEEGNYFLQPLIVSKISDTEYEIVDGQQRLTTINAILEACNEKPIPMKLKRDENKLEENAFDKVFKQDVKSFLEKHVISQDQLDKQIEEIKKTFNINLNENEDESKEVILKAFSNLEIYSKAALEKKIKSVFFVWEEYEWDEAEREENAINLFQAVNSGKIRLTSAELVKSYAIMYLEEEYVNSIWNKINETLFDDKFWTYITLFDPDIAERFKDTRIDFILCSVFNVSSEDLLKRSDEAFLRFLAYITPSVDIIKIRETVNAMDKTLDFLISIYSDFSLFHYFGLLMLCSRNERFTLKEIISKPDNNHALYMPSFEKGKKQFLSVLKEKLKTEIKTEDLEKLSFTNYYDKKEITNILFAHNVFSSYNSKIRFPFERMNESFDIEHVNPQNPLEKDDQLKTSFKKLANKDDENIAIDELYALLINGNEILKEEKEKALKEYFNEEINTFQSTNSIGNLVLLNSHTNREYKNEPFLIKRETIWKEAKEQKNYIPPCTLNVFMKNYGGKGLLKPLSWTDDDANAYKDDIRTTVDKALKNNN